MRTSGHEVVTSLCACGWFIFYIKDSLGLYCVIDFGRQVTLVGKLWGCIELPGVGLQN